MKSKIYLILIVLIFISLPVLVFAQEDGGVNFSPQVNVPESEFTPGETVEVTGNTFADYIIAIYNWGIRIIIVLAVIMIMIGGFMWMTAAGSSQRIGQAKDRITSAIVGLVLALGSYTLLNFINPELVSFRSLTLTQVERKDFAKIFECSYGIEVESLLHYDDSSFEIEDWDKCYILYEPKPIWVQIDDQDPERADFYFFMETDSNNETCGKLEHLRSEDKYYIATQCEDDNDVCVIPTEDVYTQENPLQAYIDPRSREGYENILIRKTYAGAECIERDKIEDLI